MPYCCLLMKRLVPIGMLLLATCAAQEATAPRAIGANPIGTVRSGDATVTGSVVLAGGGTTVISGSQISAGAHSAQITLQRGGELDVCPASRITIASSGSGKENLIGLEAGAVEAHYDLDSVSDAIMTPDLRIALPGPGTFHVAVSTRSNGDSCVQTLPGDTASVIATELFGEGTHQVKPGEALLFHRGVPAKEQPSACGCPVLPTAAPVNTAESKDLAFPIEQSKQAAAAAAEGKPIPQQPSTFPVATTDKDLQARMQVDAPLVYHAPEPAAPKPAAKQEASVPPSATPVAEAASANVEKPAEQQTPAQVAQAKPQKRNIFQRFGAAIAGLFHRKKSPASPPVSTVQP
jgi:hypothetical protein